MPDPIKVFIVESQPVFAKGLASLIQSTPGFLAAAEAANPADALKMIKKIKPKLVILDIVLGKESGLNLIPQIRAFDSEIMILVLSMCDERF